MTYNVFGGTLNPAQSNLPSLTFTNSLIIPNPHAPSKLDDDIGQ